MKDNMTFPPHRFVKNGADVSPLIVLNQYQDDTDNTVREIANITDRPFNLLEISGLDWNDDLTLGQWAQSAKATPQEKDWQIFT